MLKSVCVYCGALPGADPEYRKVATDLGARLAEKGIRLVYGGGNVGLMGAVADAVIDNGGEAIGVIPRNLLERELAHRRLSDLRVVESMHERKALMVELSDGFIALPGGFGTFEEIFETVTWLQLGVHGKPCALLNVGGFYSELISFLNFASAQGFITAEDRRFLMDAEDIDSLMAMLESYKPADTTKWMALEQT